MHSNDMSILYVGAKLPSRSETFVYREVFALREQGADVQVASVHAPENSLGEERLTKMAKQVIPVYQKGSLKILWDVAKRLGKQPARTSKTVLTGLGDAIFGRKVPITKRPKLFIQCLAGIALAERCQHLGVTHIHSHMAHVPTSIAMYAAMSLGLPFSFTGHAADLFRDFSLLPTKLQRAKFVSCISQWHRDYYQQLIPGLQSEKLPVIRCGVDLKEFHTTKCQNTSTQINIASVGRLVEKKGFDVLIHACEILLLEGKDVHCRIVGDGPEYSRLGSLIDSKQLGDRVQLVGGKPHSQIREIISTADLFILPCRTAESGDKDGIPVVLMEAMACGIPVISGDLVTIRELVIHGETGIMARPGDAADLAAKIAELMGQNDLRNRLAQNGRERVNKEFSIDTNVRRLLTAFQSTNFHDARMSCS